MFSNNKQRIISLYDEYKKRNKKLDIIDIIPMQIKTSSSDEIAYTDNEELMYCISNGVSVNLYYHKKLFSCQDEYIKAILFHEFTHISDAYNFVGFDYSNILMSTYSEFNAMKIEILVKGNGKAPMLDDLICDENGTTTPRKEIEDYLNSILDISKLVMQYPEKIQEKKGWLFNLYVKYYSWMFAYLFFYERTQRMFFESCFEKLELYEQDVFAKRIYEKIQNLDDIKSDPQKLLSDVVDLYNSYFE